MFRENPPFQHFVDTYLGPLIDTVEGRNRTAHAGNPNSPDYFVFQVRQDNTAIVPEGTLIFFGDDSVYPEKFAQLKCDVEVVLDSWTEDFRKYWKQKEFLVMVAERETGFRFGFRSILRFL